MSLAATAATPLRKSPLLWLGLGTTLQLVPFQCSIKVVSTLLVCCQPTAHASLVASIATPRRIWRSPGLGLVTRVQLLPSQCMVIVPPPEPTAHASLVATAATPSSSEVPPG